MSGALVWLGVGVVGGVGALARFLVDAAVSSRAAGRFPAGTFIVNLSGALLLGLVVGFAADGDALLLAGTAALGSYTTFSTWLFETHRLAEGDQRSAIAINIIGSLVLGVAAAALGRAIGGG